AHCRQARLLPSLRVCVEHHRFRQGVPRVVHHAGLHRRAADVQPDKLATHGQALICKVQLTRRGQFALPEFPPIAYRRSMRARLVHYAMLTAILALVSLPNLGAASLWDMDEGVNAECSREMMETGTWIVPTWNYDLRTAKPVMLYWLQRASYNLF